MIINRANIKYAIDLIASLAIIIACGLVVWVGLSARTGSAKSASKAPTSKPVEDVAAKHLEVSIAGAPALGATSPPIALIEFSDFECPFCRRFTENTLDELTKQFIDTGIISYFYVHHPLARIHKSAMAAARVAECANDQDRFWDVHAALFKAAGSSGLTDDSIAAVVNQTQLDKNQLDTCLVTVEARLQRDLEEAARLGVNSTPTFFLGIKSADGRVALRSRVNGAQPFDVFASAIKNLRKDL